MRWRRRLYLRRVGGLRRVTVTRLPLLRRVLVAGGGLLRIIGCLILARVGIQIATAVLAVAGRGIVVAGGILPVEEPAHHFPHSFAELGQKLNRALVLRLRLLWVSVAPGLLLAAGGGRRLLGVLRLLWVCPSLRLRVVALLRLGGCRRSDDEDDTPAQPIGAAQVRRNGSRVHSV